MADAWGRTSAMEVFLLRVSRKKERIILLRRFFYSEKRTGRADAVVMRCYLRPGRGKRASEGFRLCHVGGALPKVES